VERNVELKNFTTLKVGGKADYFCVVKNKGDLEKAILFAEENSLPFFVLGGGSNILFSDAGFRGLVIKNEINGVRFENLDNENVRVTAGAGVLWDEFVAETVDKNLYGLQNLSLIPGTVGASPVQNIGAYGEQVSDYIESVLVFDSQEKKYKTFSRAECLFSYRDSLFKKPESKKYIIISVSFLLQKNGTLKMDYPDIKNYFADKKETVETEKLVIYK
jgi:UDP-N-acetylmuramate dehydrogenase